jgi:hypothetical protein
MKASDSLWSDVSMRALIQVEDILSMGFALLLAQTIRNKQFWNLEHVVQMQMIAVST